MFKAFTLDDGFTTDWHEREPGVHAEAQIVAYIFLKYLGKIFEPIDNLCYIGVSKVCCPSCICLINAVNQYMIKNQNILKNRGLQPFQFAVRGGHGVPFKWKTPRLFTKNKQSPETKKIEEFDRII
ncbi:MAG: hypothetical protein JKY13_03810, partial [Gammaproteobacteria bacterium]|nr:hypothetical protein [Gammaproteobacteria bacterium]